MNSDNADSTTAALPEDRSWSIDGPTDGPHWPDRDSQSHTWGAFAGLAVELGGYGDLILVDPTDGRRLWIGDAFDEVTDDRSFLRALRRALDVAEATGFLEDTARAEQAEKDRRVRLYGDATQS